MIARCDKERVLFAGRGGRLFLRLLEEIVAKVKPAVYVKGGDYTLATLPEAKIVQSYGGQVQFIDLVPGRSTTKIIEKINAR